MVRAIHAMERRLQDLERKFQNKERLGKIVQVKYEKDRWYVKMNDGDDQTPSGSETFSQQDTFKSTWMPWQSFSHGTIKYSTPPKVGQHALLRSVGGMPELATVEPYHYGPDTPSPHGKQDETVGLIHEKEDQQHWVHQTKDSNHLIIKSKKQGGGIPGLGGIGGLGDLAGLGQLAGLSGMDFSGMLGALGNLGNLGNLANLDISNLTNMTQLTQLTQLGGLANISQLANIGNLAKMAGLPDLAKLGNIVNIAQQVKSAGLMGVVGKMIGGGAGGAAGVPASLGGGGGSGGGGDAAGGGGQGQSQQTQAPKLPEVSEDGEDGVTRTLNDKEKILKTVGKNKSYYRQDEEKVNIRYGEKDAKGDVLMDENQVKVQFKDKKAMVKWTEEDLTVQMGDDDKSKIHLTEEVVHLSQGENAHIEMKEDGILYKVGETSMYLADDGLTITAGGTFWKFSGSGLHQTGGDIGHNKKSIGFLHIHGATPPPSLPFNGDEGAPHTGGPTDAGGGPDPGTGTA